MAEKLCTNCGRPMAEGDTVCPSCGAPAPDASAAPDPAAPEPSGPEPAAPDPAPPAAAMPVAAPSAGSVATPLNLARAAKVFALLLFLLPWVTISCANQPIVSLSGMDMMTGSVSVTNPMTGAVQTQSESPDFMVIVAALLIVGALVASFLLARRTAGLVGLAASAASAALLLYAVLVGVRGRLRSQVEADAGAGAGGDAMPKNVEDSIADMITVDVAAAFWLTVAALAAAAFFGWRAWSHRGG